MQKTSRLHRLLAVVVAVFMAVCCLPLGAFADGVVNFYIDYVNIGDGYSVGGQAVSGTPDAGGLVKTADLGLQAPAGFKTVNVPEYLAAEEGGTFNIQVEEVETPATKEVKINYVIEVEGEETRYIDGSVTVPFEATSVNTSMLTDIPEGYEVINIGDVQINDGWIYVELKPVATDKTVNINFYDEVNNCQVEEATITVAADATSVNVSLIKIPAGYEPTVTGDLVINDGWIYVGLKPVATEKTVGINFYDEVNNCQVEEATITVAADATSVNVSLIKIPAGYEPTVTGDLVINDGWIYVGLKPVATEKTVGINFYDEVNNCQVSESSITVDADAIHVNVSQIELPAGYEPTVTGDLPIRDGWIYVGLKPVEGSRVIGLNYYDEVNKTQVCEREMVVDKDATYVNTNDIPTIEGYEFISVGDLAINDGWVYVGVKPIETKVVGLNFFDEANYEQVCETYVEVPYDAIHLNTSKIELPDGYEFTTVGDLAINDGWIYVGVKCVKTLRIYWAIDNGDAADFADGSADTWTQELTWKHIHDEIALPQITVADGYVFNGWSVSGQNGEFWGPELKTMTVGDKFVADEKGGVISITANIVTREAGQGGSTGGNDGGSTGSSEQSGATAAAASAGNDTVVKTAAPADNSVKILPQTGFTAEAPAVFGGMLFAAMAGAGAYLFAMRKKLNETF